MERPKGGCVYTRVRRFKGGGGSYWVEKWKVRKIKGEIGGKGTTNKGIKRDGVGKGKEKCVEGRKASSCKPLFRST